VSVTIIALVEGDFSLTEEFLDEHGNQVLSKVVEFRPIPGLNKRAIGISYSDNSGLDVSYNADFHTSSKNTCESTKYTAGIKFTCA
jgi:hypothetical protein